MISEMFVIVCSNPVIYSCLNLFVQWNALAAITPATLDVLLKILASHRVDKPTNELGAEMCKLQHVVLKCMVRMIHVIHCSSPDQVRKNNF